MTAHSTPGSSTDELEVVWTKLHRSRHALRPVPPYGLATPPNTGNPGRRPKAQPYLREVWHLPGRSRSTPREARKKVVDTCRMWHVGLRIIPDIELIVAELATNAVRHAPAESLTVAVLLTETDVWVVVIDQGPWRPVESRQAEEDDEGGRGLVLVEELADRHGAMSAGHGTAVWAALELPPRRPLPTEDSTPTVHAPTQDEATSPHTPEDTTDAFRSHS